MQYLQLHSHSKETPSWPTKKTLAIPRRRFRATGNPNRAHGQVRQIRPRNARTRPRPWKGDIGKRIYDNVSKEAWKLWVEHSKMLMNEFRLNPLDPKSQQIMEEQMETYFFGEGAKLPDSYVPPKH